MKAFVLLLLCAANVMQTCAAYEGEDLTDYRVYIGSRPLMAFSVFSAPTSGAQKGSTPSSRQSVPTVLCGAHVIAPNLVLTSIRCYPSSTDSVDIYVFPKNMTRNLFWNTIEAKVIRDEAVTDVKFSQTYTLTPGKIISNSALLQLDAPYLKSSDFESLEIPFNQFDEEYKN